MTETTLDGELNRMAGGGAQLSRESAFWDRIAPAYAASPIKDMEAYEATLARTRAYLEKTHEVLEVGCGTGSTAVRLAPCVARITASDISEIMLEIGSGRARDAGVDNVEFAQAALPDPSLETGSYDAVLAFNTLHLVPDLPAVLRNLHCALKPGGTLISKTICMAEQSRLWAIPLFVLRMIGKAPRVELLTFADVEQAMVDAGFEVVETGVYPAPRNRFVVARKI